MDSHSFKIFFLSSSEVIPSWLALKSHVQKKPFSRQLWFGYN